MVFFVAGCITLGDYGLTYDEGESLLAGERNLEIISAALTGKALPEWPFHQITGYQFVLDSIRFFSATHLNALFFEPDSILGFHLFNLLLASAALWLLYQLVLGVSEDLWTALLAVACTAVLPKFLAHSQSNPKDLVGVFGFVGVLWLVDRAASRGLTASFASGVALGLAGANQVICALLAPFSVVWLLLRGEGSAWRRIGRIAVIGAVGAPSLVLFWPWMWQQSWSLIDETVEFFTIFDPGFDVLYLGKIHASAAMPWHYSSVMLAISTPLPIVIAAAVGVLQVGASSDAATRRTTAFALLWLVLILGADLLASSHYDGVRHILAVLPAVGLLAAIGFRAVWRLCERLKPRPAAGLAMGCVAVWSAMLLDISRQHPYHDAYLNLPSRWLVGPDAETVFELETWGGVYKEGAEWLSSHTRGWAIAVVPFGRHCAKHYLSPRIRLLRNVPRRLGRWPTYVMFMTRQTTYTPLVERLQERLAPVHTIERQNATLLKIYRVDGLDPPLRGDGEEGSDPD